MITPAMFGACGSDRSCLNRECRETEVEFPQHARNDVLVGSQSARRWPKLLSRLIPAPNETGNAQRETHTHVCKGPPYPALHGDYGPPSDAGHTLHEQVGRRRTSLSEGRLGVSVRVARPRLMRPAPGDFEVVAETPRPLARAKASERVELGTLRDWRRPGPSVVSHSPV